MRLLQFLLIAIVSTASVLPAADLSGLWIGSFSGGGRRPIVQDVAFQFVQKGTTLNGKMYVEHNSTAILKGTIDGDQITFQVLAREQNGNEINQTVLRFTGTLKEGEIEITREREETRTANNSGAAFARPGSQTFRLKRLP